MTATSIKCWGCKSSRRSRLLYSTLISRHCATAACVLGPIVSAALRAAPVTETAARRACRAWLKKIRACGKDRFNNPPAIERGHHPIKCLPWMAGESRFPGRTRQSHPHILVPERRNPQPLFGYRRYDLHPYPITPESNMLKSFDKYDKFYNI